ncbi:hypothetical protein KY330_05245 [Candidatus Woesearchaeota archaeon]|nr:hypothetical protein [Candidatus Woesearchaeota archaeon]
MTKYKRIKEKFPWEKPSGFPDYKPKEKKKYQEIPLGSLTATAIRCPVTGRECAYPGMDCKACPIMKSRNNMFEELTMDHYRHILAQLYSASRKISNLEDNVEKEKVLEDFFKNTEESVDILQGYTTWMNEMLKGLDIGKDTNKDFKYKGFDVK